MAVGPGSFNPKKWVLTANSEDSLNMPNYWTIVHHNGSAGCTEKTRVEGGWLYRSQVWDKADGTSMALAFVPDKESTESKWSEFRYKVKSSIQEIQHQCKKSDITDARIRELQWVLEIMPSE